MTPIIDRQLQYGQLQYGQLQPPSLASSLYQTLLLTILILRRLTREPYSHLSLERWIEAQMPCSEARMRSGPVYDQFTPKSGR